MDRVAEMLPLPLFFECRRYSQGNLVVYQTLSSGFVSNDRIAWSAVADIPTMLATLV